MDVSRLRKRWRALQKERERLEEIILAREALIKGSVVTVFKACGHPNCRCARGEKHGPFLYLSASVGGRTRTWHIPKKHERRVEARANSYKRFRTARQRLGEIQRDLVQLMNRMEAFRTEEVSFGGKAKRSEKRREGKTGRTKAAKAQRANKKATGRSTR